MVPRKALSVQRIILTEEVPKNSHLGVLNAFLVLNVETTGRLRARPADVRLSGVLCKRDCDWLSRLVTR